MTKKCSGSQRRPEDAGHSLPAGDATVPPVAPSSPERICAIDAVMSAAAFDNTDAAGPQGGRWAGGIQLVPSARHHDVVPLQRVPEPDGPTGALLVALLNQFALAQQQMFEQFQQVVLAMMGTMATLQREQADLVRRELEKVRELTRELSTFQASAGRSPADATRAAESGPIPVAGRDAAGLVRADGQRPTPDAAAPVAGLPPAAEPAEAATPYLWLTQRIAAIQAERQSRLGRVLGLILGRS
jgi:hypothetical protein